ncbi:MAG: methyl-accepting chemotaxis protein [Rubrivivax sp.]|nr:methyl-accepting chemotaxis protein [Rubrivivax sp.]
MKILTVATNAFARMNVGRQFAAGFAMVLVLMALLGAVSVLSLGKADERARELEGKWLAGVGHLAEARAAIIEMRDLELKHSRTDDRSYHSEYEEKFAAARKTVATSLAAYKALVVGEDEAKLLAAFDKGWAEYQRFSQQVLALGRDKKQTDAADIADGASSMNLDEALRALTAITRFNFEGGHTAATAAHTTSVQTRSVVLGLLVAALVLGAAMALLITRSLLGQLGGEPRAAVQLARAVAAGDLSTPIALKPGDSTSLMAALQAMQHGLTDAVRQVRQGSEGVASASQQIAQGNQDLSQRTEEQASALEETAASMEQLGSTVRQNADNARQANQLALGASTVAVKGGEVVGQVVQTMKGINDSSKKIADIISVIDGIAFQTNILALNAAVEAARAGEQGRGFAVVAGEVRNLAQRSAEAAKEIKGLITASVERVAQGTALVDQAGTTMTEIVASIKRVTDIMGEISAASNEQSSGVAQVGEAVSQMDQATQQNAALVEESAAAAESLKGQAQQLVQAVAVFKLAQDAAAVAAAPARAGAERRGPDRAKNVTRPSFGKAKAKTPVAAVPAVSATAAMPAVAVAAAAVPAKTGTDGDWTSF